ncbi:MULTISPECIES: winged helix-turn-helix transcriptional regulator [Amycolatopsis]|uniref:Winged helix-turn-helix transcriptional regulator n=1 Tax=Amycolatopsis thermalba TaxID=944492 RepID=A0ABY4NYU3_9PSEU|nr:MULTISPECIES: winged helix-turn-helix transcriptional regulator [Amycolatopsis]UQS25221.1 winged helix-turn-helix transcriptional regulator [Amycolatopsis thermalba]
MACDVREVLDRIGDTWTVPARVEYALTPTGHSLTFVLKAVADWAAEHRHTVIESRARWDRGTAAPGPGVA